MPVFALIDGNSFYCSCQRAFDPRLRALPVVVLSNNDGCAIARTREAKQIGIKMGDPWHMARQRPETKGVVWYSSNYALYADMSRRMHDVLVQYVPRVEAYSIDEMFLDYTGMPDLPGLSRRVRDAVLRDAKIPTCVGWGPSKTIAKLANGIAKDHAEMKGLCDLTDPQIRAEWYARMEIGEVWGIGKQTAAKLAKAGVNTIADFISMDARMARDMLTVVGGRIQAELRGQSCLPMSDVGAPRKSIASTRTFGRMVSDLSEMREAVAYYATRAGEKLRGDNLAAGHIAVFLQTNPHNGDRWYSNQAAMAIEPTSDTCVLIGHATQLLTSIWRDRYRYFKAGVILTDLSPAGVQATIFASRNPETSARAMAALDAINARFGRGTLRSAAAGIERSWRPRQSLLSGRYTTRLNEIVRAKSW